MLTRLAVEPGAFVRRDTLIGLLWPALDMDRARSALRQSLYHLRRSLGETVVVSRGDDEVGLDAGRLWCDAAAMSDALSDGDREAGVELYRGDLLEGFFLPGAPEFERWTRPAFALASTSQASIRSTSSRSASCASTPVRACDMRRQIVDR